MDSIWTISLLFEAAGSHKTFSKRHCLSQIYFFSVTPPVQTTVSGLCPGPKWTPYGQYCYRVQTTPLHSWNDARYACRVMGGADLASVHSMDEMNFVVQQFKSQIHNPTAAVWLGMSKGFSGKIKDVNFVS